MAGSTRLNFTVVVHVGRDVLGYVDSVAVVRAAAAFKKSSWSNRIVPGKERGKKEKVVGRGKRDFE